MSPGVIGAFPPPFPSPISPFLSPPPQIFHLSWRASGRKVLAFQLNPDCGLRPGVYQKSCWHFFMSLASALFLLCLGWAITGHPSRMEFSAALVASECHQLQPGSQALPLVCTQLEWNSSFPAQASLYGLGTGSEQAHHISSVTEALQAKIIFPTKSSAALDCAFLFPMLSVDMASD